MSTTSSDRPPVLHLSLTPCDGEHEHRLLYVGDDIRVIECSAAGIVWTDPPSDRKFTIAYSFVSGVEFRWLD